MFYHVNLLKKVLIIYNFIKMSIYSSDFKTIENDRNELKVVRWLGYKRRIACLI